MTTGAVPDHVTTEARELYELALRVLPEVIDLCERYERLEWASLEPLPAADEPGGQEVEDSEAIRYHRVAGDALSVLLLKIEEATHSITTPETLVERLPVEVPEYERLLRRHYDGAAGLIEMGRRMERGD